MFVDAGLRDIGLQLIPILTTSFLEWNHRMGVEQFLSNAIDQTIQTIITRVRALAWLDDLRARDAKGRFIGVAMLYRVAGTRPAPCVRCRTAQ